MTDLWGRCVRIKRKLICLAAPCFHGNSMAKLLIDREGVVYHSRWAAGGKLHLDSACKGLESSADVVDSEYIDVWELCERERLLCRMCSLGPVLKAVLCDRVHGAGVFVTLTSNAPEWLDSQTGEVLTWSEPSASAQRRLIRAAKAAKFHMTFCTLGPVAYGMVSDNAAKCLPRLARCAVLNHRGDTPIDPLAVETYWSLADELLGTKMSVSELWKTSVLLTVGR
jgi:hypothetical protein